MITLDRSEQQTLLPAIAQMLQFSPDEQQAVAERVRRGPLRRVAGGVSNLLFGPPP